MAPVFAGVPSVLLDFGWICGASVFWSVSFALILDGLAAPVSAGLLVLP